MSPAPEQLKAKARQAGKALGEIKGLLYELFLQMRVAKMPEAENLIEEVERLAAIAIKLQSIE